MIFEKNKQPKPPYIPANHPHPAVMYKGTETKLVQNAGAEAAAKKLGFTSTAPDPQAAAAEEIEKGKAATQLAKAQETQVVDAVNLKALKAPPPNPPKA